MSITSGFEDNHDGNSYNTFAVDQLLAHARALEEMLRKHEWILDDHAGNAYCPECGSKINAHSLDCALAKIIGE